MNLTRPSTSATNANKIISKTINDSVKAVNMPVILPNPEGWVVVVTVIFKQSSGQFSKSSPSSHSSLPHTAPVGISPTGGCSDGFVVVVVVGSSLQSLGHI